MNIMYQEHISTLKALASGIDPITGEPYEPSSTYNQPQVIRALFYALERISSVEHSSPRPKMTLEEKQQANLDKGVPLNAGLPWTDETREEVAKRFSNNETIGDIAKALGRTHSAIRSELIRQGLIE